VAVAYLINGTVILWFPIGWPPLAYGARRRR